MPLRVTNHTQCKVCNSRMRDRMEALYSKGFSIQKIYDFLHDLQDEADKAIIAEENIAMTSMYRHFSKHYNEDDNKKLENIELRGRAQRSRSLYNEGLTVVVDKINTLNHMIDLSLINIEELEKTNDRSKERHQLTVGYMNSVRQMVETLGKLTGDLRQEGTIDINFFNNEIHMFADMVIGTIRELDHKLNLQGLLEREFVVEFKDQWDAYRDRQQRLESGELSAREAARAHQNNLFNDVGGE